jgi:hypothetical protein
MAVMLLALWLLPGVSAAALSRSLLYEWEPNGETSGPQLVLEEKSDLTGKFGVQCGSIWVFSYFGGGPNPPLSLSRETGVIAGTESYPTNTVGIGSSYRAAEVDYYQIKSAGPVVLTLSGQATQAVATGTLALKVYRYTKAHRVHGRKVKAKKVLRASCSVAFDAPNHYYEPPAAPE